MNDSHEYSPNTLDVRYDYAIHVDWLRDERLVLFDRWLAEERARAWAEGAQHVASGRLRTDNPYERP